MMFFRQTLGFASPFPSSMWRVSSLVSLYAVLWMQALLVGPTRVHIFVNAMSPGSELVSRSLPLEAREDSGVAALSASQVSSFRPYTYYASAAYCTSDRIMNWTCGRDCEANPTFRPVAAGGDGDKVQYWFVGYDTALKVVIVSHQGTDPNKLMPVLTDLKIKMVELDGRYFPGLPPDIRVHNGFTTQHLMSASDVYSAVRKAVTDSRFKTVTVVGHSLGGALALLTSVYLPTFMPNVAYNAITFGMPRVGNDAFADYVDKTYFHFNLTRITNKRDPVPTIPGRHDGFRHPTGETHIQADGPWLSCFGQENEDQGCSIGSVPDVIKDGNVTDHGGPYGGIVIGCPRSRS